MLRPSAALCPTKCGVRIIGGWPWHGAAILRNKERKISLGRPAIKLRDPHIAFRQVRDEFEVAAEGFDEALQGADLHVGLRFECHV